MGFCLIQCWFRGVFVLAAYAQRGAGLQPHHPKGKIPIFFYQTSLQDIKFDLRQKIVLEL